MPKNADNYICEICNFTCSKESNWNIHNLTNKHKIRTNTKVALNKNAVDYSCSCGKLYKHASSLWNHKKKCSILPEGKTDNPLISTPTPTPTSTLTHTTSSDIDKEMLIKLLLKNQDVMEKMMEIIPQVGISHSNNTTSNSHNTNNFNINMFLNEHCKNAMNLTEFIDTLPITAETYDNTIENGLTKTITTMITNGLSQLDVLERPIHCTDATRKTLYVKEDNVWEKDNDLIQILLGIRNLAHKQRTMITKWKDVNNGWDKDDKIQTKFTNLICNSMEDIENDNKETSKIIRSIGKNTYINNYVKSTYYA